MRTDPISDGRRHPALKPVVAPVVTALLAAAAASAPAPAAVSIFGGPTFAPWTGEGYSLPKLEYAPGASAGDGVGVGDASKYEGGIEKGPRAVRWDASGAVELDHLGASAAGTAYARAVAVNAAGTAVGYSERHDAGAVKGTRPVRWGASGTAATELETLGTSTNGQAYGAAYAINAAGTAVGYSHKFVGGNPLGDQAVRWDAVGTAAIPLGNINPSDAFGSADGSKAYAINDAGTAVGVAAKRAGANTAGTRAVRWDAAGAATELGHIGTTTGGTTTAQAWAVNAGGTAVGYAQKYESGNSKGTRAVRWDASTTAATELGHLGTTTGGSSTSRAYDVNAAGTAVGYANKYVSGSFKGGRAVRWDASSAEAIELGTLGTSASGFTDSYAYAINDAGITVGESKRYSDAGVALDTRAVMWGPGGTAAIDLNTLLSPADAAVWTLTGARGISDTGWVTGLGAFDPDGSGPGIGYVRLFLMRACVPGDANLDGVVDGDDVALADRGSAKGLAGWSNGDFDGDGAVDADDYLALDAAYARSGNALGPALLAERAARFGDGYVAALTASVPEPGTACGLVVAGLAAVGRHRRPGRRA